MLKILTPNKMIDSIYDIDFKELKEKNIQGLLIDVDNTLVGWNKREADEKLIQWFYKAKEEGFLLCLISNNTEERVVEFKKDMDIPAIHKALKPLTKSFIRGVNIMNLKREEVAVIGDQIFTDVLGGNRAGLYTILVQPIPGREFWWTTLVRRLEKIVLKKLTQ
ncbi:MAG TPA: YqeG family HAD IIIA-type phosphatase [Eubacteriaceae bacterium]|nr:YqeG family HAD IIIA-type phosphatase [Eubacteriaceae bacterium]